MNKIDEKKLREKIRSQLEEKHSKKQTKTKQAKQSESNEDKPEKHLTAAQKKYIRSVIEEEVFSQSRLFIKCENHLNEFRWLTAVELADQYEFYPVDQNTWSRISEVFTKSKKIPTFSAAQEYAEKIRIEIQADMEKRAEHYKKLIKEHEQKEKESLVDEIIRQEEEDFYRTHPDYKLYRNELGQTKWMTEEEFFAQEEFGFEVKPLYQRILMGGLYLLGVIATIVILWYGAQLLKGERSKGILYINTNEARGHLYINEKLFVGFSPGSPLKIAPGNYRITLRKAGFSPAPSYYDIEITQDDTVHVNFNLEPISEGSRGVVYIKAEYKDAKIFVNDEFYGIAQNNEVLTLNPGKYNIELKKEAFETFPRASNISIAPGDTLNLSYKFAERQAVKSKTSSALNFGILEVSSNVEGAQIYLNGKDSGYETDYIFNRLEYGDYNISLEKEGFQVYPREKQVSLNNSNQTARAEFKLTRSSVSVLITTEPSTGAIFIDGKKMGNGTWRGSLPVGDHKIRFGELKYYQQPPEQIIHIRENTENNFDFTYTPNFRIEFSADGAGDDPSAGAFYPGYYEDGKFVHDIENGPAVVVAREIGQKIWKMGYAFEYRNPPGHDAIVFSFNIPGQVEIGYDYSVKIWGYRTNERFPVEISTKSSIKILINNMLIQDKYQPRYTLKEASENRYEEFQIGNLLRYGQNTLTISTADDNATYFALWKVSIE